MTKMLLPSDFQSLVECVASAEGLTNFEITTVEANNKAEGFLSKIYMVSVLDKTKNQKLNILIKKAFENDSIRDKTPIRKSFENEVSFYQNIWPTLERFRMENRCRSNIDLVPKCFSACLDDRIESLVFENLKYQDFQVIDKKMYLDSDHMALIFQQYGYFHALSFAMKLKEPDTFSRITSQISSVYEDFFDSEFCKGYSAKLFGEINESWVLGDEDDEIEKKAFQKYLPNPLVKIKPCLTGDDKYSVLLHGDCWSNNMLFKYEKQSDKPVDIRLIDFQFLRLGNPICDLSYALYSGAPKAVYDNFADYLKIYHESFSLTLAQFGLDANQLYPFSLLKEHWRFYAEFGLFMSVMIIRTKTTEANDMLDFHDSTDPDAFMNVAFNRDEYFSRVKDLFRHIRQANSS